MEEVVSPENYGKALKAVIANGGAPDIDGMKTEELNGHLLQHWPKIHAKLRIAGRPSGWRDGFDGICGNASGCGGTNRREKAQATQPKAAGEPGTLPGPGACKLRYRTGDYAVMAF